MNKYWSRKVFIVVSLVLIALAFFSTQYWPPARWSFILVAAFILQGIRDSLQRKHALLKNFPVLAHLRYFLESIRTEIRQYFIESDADEYPFSREMRSVVYQRAKAELDTLAFGTRLDVYKVGYEWISHSLNPTHPKEDVARVWLGKEQCKQSYHASLFNVSAMSFGSLSDRAILALNEGAKMGHFYHNTGEGGLSPYHLKPGGDICWQIGTGYFGCRNEDGRFEPKLFQEKAHLPQVKLIELKLSQGAKPAHGGILPAAKVTPEIAAIRHVPMGRDVISPPAHSAFSSPKGMLEFITQLRELSGGKPVGFKLCVGSKSEFFSICKAMMETKLYPDFITVDGAEGGTGAAPLEFSNHVGMPLNDGLSFVNYALIGCGLRDKIKINAAGKIVTGFHIITKLALGADFLDAARSMMFALGCIQALKCNTNKCPTGVATQDPSLVSGLNVDDKAHRVASFQKRTVESVLHLLGAAGLNSPDEVQPYHIYRRTGPSEIKQLIEIYPPVEPNCLAEGEIPERWIRGWKEASSERF